jgi:hypothetical protein
MFMKEGTEPLRTREQRNVASREPHTKEINVGKYDPQLFPRLDEDSPYTLQRQNKLHRANLENMD